MRKLKIKIDDKDYTLEMTRESIKWLEATGFTIEEFSRKPVTFYDLIWTSLFVTNHNDINSDSAIKLMNIYKESGKNPTKVIKFGIEEYQAFMNALTDIDSMESEELEIIEL